MVEIFLKNIKSYLQEFAVVVAQILENLGPEWSYQIIVVRYEAIFKKFWVFNRFFRRFLKRKQKQSGASFASKIRLFLEKRFKKGEKTQNFQKISS